MGLPAPGEIETVAPIETVWSVLIDDELVIDAYGLGVRMRIVEVHGTPGAHQSMASHVASRCTWGTG